MFYVKVKVGSDQEKKQTERDFHSKNRDGENYNNNQVIIK